MKNLKLLWLLAAACSLTFASCNKDNDGPDTSTTVTFESATLPDAGYINNTSYTEQGVRSITSMMCKASICLPVLPYRNCMIR